MPLATSRLLAFAGMLAFVAFIALGLSPQAARAESPAVTTTLAPATGNAGSCQANSPAQRVALVELYTAEGCGSCPPADEWLGKLAASVSSEQAIALALHVPYWDRLGWKDRFASPVFERRQRELAAYNNTSTVYTPQVFAAGYEMRRWNNGSQVQGQIRSTNSKPSPLHLALRLEGERLSLSWRELQAMPPWNWYLLVTAASARSQVRGGENKGIALHHTNVVRWWQGPINITAAQGEVSLKLPQLEGEEGDAQGSIVAFAQDETGAVVQAVALRKDCAQTGKP